MAASKSGNSGIVDEFFLTIRKGSLEGVQRLIRKKSDLIGATDAQSGVSCLHVAASGSNVAIVDLLLELGVSPCHRDNRGWTPLHLACNSSSPCYLDIIRRLLRTAATSQVRAKTDSANTPLALLAKNTTFLMTPGAEALYVECLQALITAGADASSRNDEGITPLHEAVSRNNLLAVSTLLTQGADVNRKTELGFLTPLHWAVEMGNPNIVRALLRAGADIYVESDKGVTPLDLGLRSRVPEIVELFQDPNLPQKPTLSLLSSSSSSAHSSSSSSLLSPSPALSTPSTPAPASPSVSDSDNPFECRVCIDNKIDCALIPCGHSVLCQTCADDVKLRHGKCPICRATIDGSLKIFLG